jgi:gluconokinase
LSGKTSLITLDDWIQSGKSTIGMSLAQSLSLPFIDGDTLHPKTNVEKMTAGTPLTDTDRLPWLALIRSTAERICREEWINQKRSLFGVLGSGEEGSLSRETEDIAGMAEWEFGEGWKWRHAVEEEGSSRQRSLGRPAVVMACSALKKSYREILRGSVEVDLPVEENDGNGTTKVIVTVHTLTFLRGRERFGTDFR